jgi:hypothetical protein
MSVYRIETTLSEDRTLLLDDLPFPAGAAVEVIIQERPVLPSAPCASRSI